MTALPSPEVVQAFILNTLSTNPDGTIPDSREISYNGRELRTAEEQAVVKGVLSSLVSKEVSLHTVGVWDGVFNCVAARFEDSGRPSSRLSTE